MSLDDFISQHYGNTTSDEDSMKLANAQFFLKVAADNGIDINNLNDAQVDELWNHVWSQKVAEDEQCSKEEKAKKELDKKKEEAKEAQAQFIQADEMGRVMAHSYVNNLQKIAAAGGLDFMKEADEKAEERGWAGQQYDKAKKHVGNAADAVGNHLGRVGERVSRVGGHKIGPHTETGARAFISNHRKAVGAGVYGAGAAALGGAAYGVHRALKKDDAEKTSSAIDELAAQYAIEKAAAYGFNPEEAAQRVTAVLVLGPGESDKIAYAGNLEGAVDLRSSELLELAGYPIDWTGTGFEKEAGDRYDKTIAKGKELAGKAYEGAKFHGQAGSIRKLFGKREGWEQGSTKDHVLGRLKAHGARAAGEAAVGAGAVGGAGYGVHRALKKSDGDKEASANFDNAAAELAVEKAASAGWDPEYVAGRINSVFNLGYEGDPMDSEKVASVNDTESALHMRACELLEIAGFNINW